MYTNADITVYNKYFDPSTRLDGFKRTIIRNVFWDEKKAYNRLQSGLESADHVFILIPFDNLAEGEYVSPKAFDGQDNTFTLAVGDRVVRGAIDYEITKGSDLDKNYDAYVITSVDKKDFGSNHMRHFELGAK